MQQFTRLSILAPYKRNMQDLRQFFTEQHFIETVPEGTYEPMQWGANINYAIGDDFDWEEADIVIVGCGGYDSDADNSGPDAIRAELYRMYGWHSNIKIADAGNILKGAKTRDTLAALRTVLAELHQAGKTVLLLGGPHDLTMQQYEAFKKSEQLIHATVTDMLIDMDDTEEVTSRSFLMDMLTGQPNFIRHYNHIGFQSYYVHPKILETLDRLRFDFYRLGVVREHMEDMEPVLRSSHMYSFDINAIRHGDAPANINGSPNGFTGDEACQLMRYAGMAPHLSSVGIYGYNPADDMHNMTARQMAQMIWYFIDGCYIRKNEAVLTDREEYFSFSVNFTENDTIFLKSKRTNRWWMQMPDGSFIPCSYKDYQLASTGDIPERWLREQERLV